MMPKKERKKGLFLSIEGPDGAGKTTQARLLKERLENWAASCFNQEPGGTPIGKRSKLLLNPDFRNDRSLRNTALQRSPCPTGQECYILPCKKELLLSVTVLDSNIVYQGLAGKTEV